MVKSIRQLQNRAVKAKGLREPLWLTTVEQGAIVFFDQCDGRCLLGGYRPGERKAYLRETLARHSTQDLPGRMSSMFAPASLFVQVAGC